MSAQELKEHLARDVAGALAPTRAKTRHDNGSPPAEGAARQPRGKRVEEGPPDLLATDDAVVVAERLPDVARYIRDQLGYTLLSNITATDYLADGVIEMVYHFMHLDGGAPLVVKVRVPREQPVVPSITSLWPGADLQEREAYDLYGVFFVGHPDMRRILTDYGFEGHPLRKDFPLTGFVEVRWDDEQKRVVYDKVRLAQEFRNFDFLSPWEGMTTLPGDEKVHLNRIEGPKPSGANQGTTP